LEFYYWTYGLKVKSEIYFPELFPIEPSNNFDVFIVLGQVPMHSNENADNVNRKLFIDDARFKLIVPGIAKYWASKGAEIIIQKFEDSNEDEIRLFCLSNVFAAILHQRNIIPLHAASIKYNNQLLLFCGESGAGKSTLLASLISKGFEVFSDDVSVPFLSEDNSVFMHSSYPMMKFWKDSFSGFLNGIKPDIQLRPDVDKYGFYFHDKFDCHALKPVLVFFIDKVEDKRDLTIGEIKGIELFQKLTTNVYRGDFLGGYDLRTHHFSLLTNLANQIKGYVIKRPAAINTVNLISDKVEKIIQSNF
jgi:hypothetical protein